MNKFYHISFQFDSGNHLTAELDPIFNKAKDWIRYAPNCWIIYTSQDPDKWYNSIKKAIDKEDNFMMLEVNPSTKTGWMPLDVWEWFDKDRTPKKMVIKNLSKD